MNQYDIEVKSNLEYGKPVAVRITCRDKISDHVLELLKDMKFNDARQYCQRVLHANFVER